LQNITKNNLATPTFKLNPIKSRVSEDVFKKCGNRITLPIL
jgi:hypothetical protein